MSIGYMERGLTAHILAIAGMSTLIGTRVYSRSVPQKGLFPCIVLNRISNPPEKDLSGASGLVYANMQLDCYGKTIDTLRPVARLLKQNLDNVKNVLWDGDVDIRVVSLKDEGDEDEEPLDGSEEIIIRQRCEYLIIYRD